ncbi:hypothetical protein [Spirosoma montaniterrae]|uniref:Uncharacterized protein n=1 Tax=Spirosoma montaniterrae TaxID=1178516 RepID=A0A1P9WT48_9BACT|nr:hypothetical protein [Spirosoma montaniterrae]AQG78566.1 hypothetical protein AWR27_03935 [Spirosoma montaniterrae]
MIFTLDPALEETAHALGYQSAIAFARIELSNRAAQKLAFYKSRVELYEQKYGMTYEEFKARVMDPSDTSLKRFGIIEKEDDDFEWEDAVYMAQSYQRKFDALSQL